ncbi:MAG TPA: isocitrate lyase/phosphoenolpyruvate mutase family protein [Chthonomonadaceae bacterium]|nr:isocitrate lyase/phosphoenolpyruvate mutase family protein [Chthonomonadaceae bacterium]
MSGTQREKAERLRALHTGEQILVLPNAWDAISARLYEETGFPAVGTTSAGLANTLGYPDGQVAPRDEVLFIVQRIARTVQAPVTADIEGGYGVHSIEEVLKTVQGVLAAGAVGINLEDAAEANALVDIGLQREKIQAIRALANSVGVPLVINARTDAFHLGSLDAEMQWEWAVQRANAYRQAGADCLFVPFVTDGPTIARLAAAIEGPLNVLAMPGTPPVAELERLGVKRVSVGSGPHRSTLALVRRIAQELREEGVYGSFMAQTIPYPEVNKLLGGASPTV